MEKEQEEKSNDFAKEIALVVKLKLFTFLHTFLDFMNLYLLVPAMYL